MPCAAVLELDAAAAARVDRLSRRLERELGLATERQRGAPVHLSLAVYQALDVELATGAMDRFVTRVAAMPIELVSIGVFPGETNVLFLAPVVRERLLAAQRHWHQVAGHQAACMPHYQPQAWMPHVTLAMHLSEANAAAAVKLLATKWRPIHGRLASAAVICFPPVELARRWPLAGLAE